MNREHPMSKFSSSCSSELTDGKLEEHQVSILRSCPSCGHEIDCNTDMIGMPLGVKFDPSDQELIHHLEAMVDDGGSRAHPLIAEFIPTIQGDDGICYTHPENLPGVKRDGLSKHFFHRSSKAYTNGTRKRRKIQAQRDLNSSENVTEVRWHKTGKTRPVLVGGQQKGCKKILVLYTNYGKHRKPEKTKWVLHQYHLGDEEEKDGELVVSKVFYQTQTRQHVAMAVAATAAGQDLMKDEKAADTSEETQAELSSCAVANSTAVLMIQPQRMNQLADGRFSVDHSKKRRHQEEEQKKQVERSSRSLEELIKLCQSAHTAAGASTQSETQRVYQYWPPDPNQEQHG